MQLNEATSPPQPKPNDLGLLTLDQYLTLRNRDQKMHPSDAYDSVSIDSLNRYSSIFPSQVDRQPVGSSGASNWLYKVDNYEGNFSLLVEGDNLNVDINADTIVGIIYKDTLYYNPNELSQRTIETMSLKIPRHQQVKYVFKLAHKIFIELAIERNKAEAGPVIKRVRLNDEYFTFHADNTYGDSIKVYNEDFVRVAQATNEWGTTLVQVASEYRGYRIGPVLAAMYIDEFQLPSGGYTPQGRNNAEKIWTDRVSHYIQSGWYSEMIRNGDIQREQVDSILKDFKAVNKGRPSKVPNLPEKESEGELLLYTDPEYVTFVLYDERFLQQPDERFIHGYGFLRESLAKEFLYRIDFDEDHPKYRKLILYAALQSMKNQGSRLYIDAKPADFVKMDDLKFVKIDEEYAELTKDVLNLPMLRKYENKKRRSHDPHQELEYQLLEMAETKFN